MDIRNESTLHEILAQLNRSQIDRPEEMIQRAVLDYDFEFKESLRVRLEAQPKGGTTLRKIHAKMPWGAKHVYQLVSEDCELGIHFEAAFGGNIAHFAHHIFRITGEGGPLGSIHYFPNIRFIFTNREPCTALSLIDFEGERLVFYRADTVGFFRSKAYAVVTTAAGDLVAVIVEVPGWFRPKCHIKMYRPAHDVFIALLMATFHGLVFRVH